MRKNILRCSHTKQDDASGERCNNGRITTLFHDTIDDRNCKTTKDSRQSAHAPVRDVVRRVAVTDVLKIKVTFKANKPSGQSK